MGGGGLAARVRRTGAGRAAVAALVALHLAAALLGFAHNARVQHVVCAEHGELIDVPLASAPASPGPASAVAAADDDSSDDNLGSSPGHARLTDHDHCALVALDDDAVAPAIRTALPAPTATPCRTAPAPAASTDRAVPVLSIAPKTSPPA